jgi:hypothetical protein
VPLGRRGVAPEPVGGGNFEGGWNAADRVHGRRYRVARATPSPECRHR